jgi:asparagine synthetase B (glutamine-hydrolysing)
MTGIAGIASPDKSELVNHMLDKMTHRGWAWRDIL